MATDKQKQAARQNLEKAREAQSARAHGENIPHSSDEFAFGKGPGLEADSGRRQALRRRGVRVRLAGAVQGRQGPQAIAGRSRHAGGRDRSGC
jgi:hypothetical protein